MNIKYNKDKISEIITNLSILTGISISFSDIDHKYICNCKRENDFCSAIQCFSEHKNKCYCSDKDILKKCEKSRRLESHICHAGLWDAAMPIIKHDVIAGFVVMGRIRSAQSPQNPINQEDKSLCRLYNEFPYLTDEKIESLKALLPEILFENAVEIEFDSFITQVTGFIRNNLTQNINLSLICSEFHVSKNYLYKTFHSYYNCTVNEYIISERIKKAKFLLRETDEPVYKISELVGIDNYTYFSRLFKRKTGIVPSEYREMENSLLR